MNIKKLQSGRSMVEMLGVLAVIGVLSIGGISGYTLSMRRHRANGIVDAVSKYALVGYGHCQQAMLNGEVTYLSDCREIAIPFERADVGPLPSGVTSISLPWISTSSQTDTDTVFISAHFDDDQLCQAVGAVTGTGCEKNYYGNFVQFTINHK